MSKLTHFARMTGMASALVLTLATGGQPAADKPAAKPAKAAAAKAAATPSGPGAAPPGAVEEFATVMRDGIEAFRVQRLQAWPEPAPGRWS